MSGDHKVFIGDDMQFAKWLGRHLWWELYEPTGKSVEDCYHAWVNKVPWALEQFLRDNGILCSLDVFKSYCTEKKRSRQLGKENRKSQRSTQVIIAWGASQVVINRQELCELLEGRVAQMQQFIYIHEVRHIDYESLCKIGISHDLDFRGPKLKMDFHNKYEADLIVPPFFTRKIGMSRTKAKEIEDKCHHEAAKAAGQPVFGRETFALWPVDATQIVSGVCGSLGFTEHQFQRPVNSLKRSA